MASTASNPKLVSTEAGAQAASRLRAPDRAIIPLFLARGAVFPLSDDRWMMAWGEPRRQSHRDPLRPSLYAPDFLLSEPSPWFVYPHHAIVTPDGLAQLLPRPQGRQSRRTWHPFDETAWAALFRSVHQAVSAGALAKAVPVVFETSKGSMTSGELSTALHSMANLPAGLLPYGRWDRTGGVIGASPELLCEFDGVELHTMAVAGTARAGASPEELLEDPKEVTEHRLVVEDLTERLAPLGRVTRGATRLWRIGLLTHLRTDLRVTPGSPPDFAATAALLHPTPAVGLSPRGSSAEWLPRLDPQGVRERFAAPFGLALPDGTFRCLVAIRNVQWDPHQLRCGAGCGVVAASRLTRETAELRLKLAASRANLGL